MKPNLGLSQESYEWIFKSSSFFNNALCDKHTTYSFNKTEKYSLNTPSNQGSNLQICCKDFLTFQLNTEAERQQ